MSENTIDMRLLGEQIRRVLAGQHDMRTDQRLLHERLTGIKKTLGGLIEMFGQFSSAFATTSGRLDALDALDAKTTHSLDAIDAKMTQRFDAFEVKMTQGFEGVDATIDARMTQRFDATDARMAQRFDRLEAAISSLLPAGGEPPVGS